jgi:hypothetical protein
MKSNVRLTKQGIPDLNYYGPRRKPAASVEEAPATSLEEGAGPVGEIAKVVEAPGDADLPAT